MAGILYLVATPIGNLEDMTLRGLRILKEADLIACEDTRTSAPLLRHYGITTPVTAYHKFNEKEKSPYLVDVLLSGRNVALISDAGLPLISDPGSCLTEACREAGITITVVPGANAALTALLLSGADSRRFIFEGFLPQDNKEKARVLESLKTEMRTVIFYEAPHRLAKTLGDLAGALGRRRIAVCRELTKRFETTEILELTEAADLYKTKEPRGEYVLVLSGRDPDDLAREKQAAFETMSVAAHVALYEEQGLGRKEAMKAAAADRGVTKRDIYQALLSEADEA